MKRDMKRACLAAVLASTLAGCGLSPIPIESPTSTTEAETDATTTETVASPADNSAVERKDDAEYLTDEGADLYVMTESESAAADMGYMPITYGDFNTEEYSDIQETGFVLVETKPLSTVSADVDTASYANLRRMLTDGWKTVAGTGETTSVDETDEYVDESSFDYVLESRRIVPTGAVRIEEMLNYFDYDYDVPASTGTDKFKISTKIAPCPWNEKNDVVVLGFASAPEAESVRAAGANLVFLIDVSGSMDSADKLDLLKGSFSELTRTLGADDVVSIVTYSGEEKVVLEGCAGNDERTIMGAIRALDANGSTNGEAGLKMAYEVAERNYIEGGVNRIIMASDGDLNVGMTSESELHDFVDKKRDTGIYLSVLGFGEGNYKDNKMETLADHGNGSYHYIDCEAEARRVFADRLVANLVPFADDTKLQVEFNPANISAYRLLGYENRTMADEDFLDDTKDAGEVGPAAQFTVVYEVVPKGSDAGVEVSELKYSSKADSASTTAQGTHTSADSTDAYADEYLTVTLRYKDVANAGNVVSQEQVLRTSDRTTSPDADVRFCCAVTEFGMLLRDSSFKGTSSFAGIRELVGTTDDALRQEFLELVDLAEKN